METSIFLAKVFGVVYLCVALGVLTNKKHYTKMIKHITDDPVRMYFGGVMSLVVGMFIIHFHPVWVASWPVIISVIGWLAFVKGVVIVIAPNAMKNMAKFWEKRIGFMGAMSLVLGLILCYYGFVVNGIV